MPITNTFPLDFPYSSIFAEQLDTCKDVPFLVCAMFTKSHSTYAERLLQSCKEHGLPYALYEVPTVHRSISLKGSNDTKFTKANFIHFLLDKYQKSILYIDIDCYIAEYPQAIEALVQDGCDFAMYNWLADKQTESYKPVNVKFDDGAGSRVVRDRFYTFSHSIDYYSTEQLISSGAVQFNGNTPHARTLLKLWQTVIERFPDSVDDQCLDYTFNNYVDRLSGLKPVWLDKAYARYAWWIHIRPVINHPDFPYAGNDRQAIEDNSGAKRFYPERAKLLNTNYIFPRECLIDTEEMIFFTQEAGQMIPHKIEQEIWL